ncbi:C40 family peptidase [Paenibacillus macquariensis]|uniref:Cell wall-associated hydrolase, NlpC family n=1 Tax=Paenibacillus macquariensis TaxID=948756 RepID=A0ABY1K3F8_9BACL|nr:C40 family peptidase [Paenibacillus macquariensis]MEC0090333.1 NlpC/P60 family protein [Paenibacillus macquariensis]OAB39688.1 hydrolase Nlp/P60 [Paenibacillus macquariensis subsp. macquariensis]SIR19568.1 Cell wall-associated hydrolase, NlpC family [Paenibacillus macquariensis]
MMISKKVITASLTAVMLFGSLSATAFVQQVEAATTTTSKVIWGVNLRQAPSSTSTIIRMIPKGENVEVLGKSGTAFLKVKDTKGKVGYISSLSKYTQPVSTGTDNNTTINNSVEKVIKAGMKYLGTPYEYGSSRSNTSTFDCSDFVRQAFIDGVGIKLPADSRAQGNYVKAKGAVVKDVSKLKRGDVMFFMSYKGTSSSAYSSANKAKATITHTGIYLGNGEILHTYSKESGGVTISKISGTHWEKRFLFGGSAL